MTEKSEFMSSKIIYTYQIKKYRHEKKSIECIDWQDEINAVDQERPVSV